MLIVRPFKTIVGSLLLSLCFVAPAHSQEGSKPQDTAPSKVEAFYSGTIAELASDKVTVSRTVLGKPAEKRSFMITAETKVEGKMNARSRVTVRYTASEQGDVALSILVRDRVEKKKQ